MRFTCIRLQPRLFAQPVRARPCIARRCLMNGKSKATSISTTPSSGRAMFQADLPLVEMDPDIAEIIRMEKQRQVSAAFFATSRMTAFLQTNGVELIASENFTSKAVMTAVGSCLTNKYSEGRPGARYYGGNEYIDQCELLCEQRALGLYRLDSEQWGVNVQTLSGSPANFAVYTALLKPHDRIMGLDLPHGGHLTHGFMTAKRKVSATSVYFESMPYRLDESTGLIDYDKLEETAKLFRPKMIIGGASAYSRDFDYERFRKICDSVGAYFMVDMAHVSGLIASELLKDPFPYADIVTTTTHKSLRGPRGSMVFYRKQYKSQIDQAVFPGLQGGPHNHTIAGIAVALKMANTEEFKAYSRQVIANCQALSEQLASHGFKLISGGTDNHLILVDLKSKGVNGSRLQHVLDMVHVTLNKNSVPGDDNAFNPGGVRIGSPGMTTRGCREEDFVQIADFINRAVEITLELKTKTPEPGKVADFIQYADEVGPSRADLQALKEEVRQFSSSFPLPGV